MRNSELNNSHLHAAANNDEPIIVVKYAPLRGKLIVIDGNHRVFGKKLNEIKNISGYLLDTKQQMEAMAGNVHRTLFKIHYNVGWILSYMAGFETKDDLERSLLAL